MLEKLETGMILTRGHRQEGIILEVKTGKRGSEKVTLLMRAKEGYLITARYYARQVRKFWNETGRRVLINSALEVPVPAQSITTYNSAPLKPTGLHLSGYRGETYWELTRGGEGVWVSERVIRTTVKHSFQPGYKFRLPRENGGGIYTVWERLSEVDLTGQPWYIVGVEPSRIVHGVTHMRMTEDMISTGKAMQ